MEGIEVFDRPAHQSFYEVAGRLLFTESFDRELARLIERLFAGWQLTPVSFPERNADVKITFSRGESLPGIPAGLQQFEIAQGGRCHTASDHYYLEFENSLLHLEHGNPVSVSIWIKEILDAELARVTSFAVCASLRRFGLFEIHSAGVVLPAGETGVLIVGPSGSGKSTLTLALANAGWGYLSDDELLLSLVDGEVEARGFRSFFALAQSVVAPSSHGAVVERSSHDAFVARSSEGSFVARSPDGALKTCFEPVDVLSALPSPRVVPRFLLFTAVSGEKETRLHGLTQAESMTRLIRACPWATYDSSVAAENFAVLSRLARQAKGFDLLAGIDLLEPGNASRIIASACSA